MPAQAHRRRTLDLLVVPPVTDTSVQGAARRAFTERSVCLGGCDDGSGDDPAGCSWGKRRLRMAFSTAARLAGWRG